MQLVLFLQAYNRFFINSAVDFDNAANYKDIFFGADVQLKYLQQIRLKDAYVDCLAHTVTAETPPFDVVSNVTIRNCVFELRNGLSNDFNSSAFINSTVLSSSAAAVLRRVYNSLLYGVRGVTAESFASNVANATVVGCSFYLGLSPIYAKSPLFGQVSNSALQSTYFNLTVNAYYLSNVAGLSLYVQNTSFTRIRAVSNVTARLRSKGNQAAGFIARANNVTIANSDFLVYMKISYAFDIAAGVIADVNTVKISNISLVATVDAGMFDPKAQNLSVLDMGGLFASTSGTVEVSVISAFVDIKWNNSEQSQSVIVTGLTGYSLQGELKLYSCYVFGTVAIYNINSEHYYISGITSYASRGSIMDSCVFQGDIISVAAGWKFAFVGGLAVKIYALDIVNSQIIGNLHIKFGQQQKVFIAGIMADSDAGSIKYSTANVSLNIESTYSTANFAIGGFLAEIDSKDTKIENVSGIAHVYIQQANAYVFGTEVALMFATFNGNAYDCTAHGSLTIASGYINPSLCRVFGIANVAFAAYFQRISVIGNITLYENTFLMGSGFGAVAQDSALNNIFIAVAFPGQKNIIISLNGVGLAFASNIYIDCTLAGNDAREKECRADPKSQATADALGAAFGWKIEYNDGYPYLVNLPVWDGTKYVLPESGPFSAELYYVDTLGYPFLRTNYKICRGACYGTYESPLVRNCTTNTTNNNIYCIQPELAETDFQTACCIKENAHCNSGASICTSESELKLNQTDSTYICELGCPGCVNGHCRNNTCVCNLYHSGDDCSTYQCRNDSSACFGDPTMQCAADGSRCVPTDACVALGCVHGSCVINSSSNKTQCRCDNLWTGSKCDRCNAYGPECSVSQSECNRLCGAHGLCGTPLTTICTCSLGFGGANCEGCAAGHTVVGDRCVCGDSGGPCQLRQTCVDRVCVADCLLTDSYCAECEVADQSVCARCVKQHTIQNGICQYHLASAMSTSFAVVLGVAAAVAAALGAVLLFSFWSAKKKNAQKPTGDETKSPNAYYGLQKVEIMAAPLVDPIPAWQDVNVEIKINSARSNK